MWKKKNMKGVRKKFYKKQEEHHRKIWSTAQKVNKTLNPENTKESHHVLNKIFSPSMKQGPQVSITSLPLPPALLCPNPST